MAFAGGLALLRRGYAIGLRGCSCALAFSDIFALASRQLAFTVQRAAVAVPAKN